MTELLTDEAVDSLLDPLGDALELGLARLPDVGPLRVALGAIDTAYVVDATAQPPTLTLSTGLSGPDLHHPAEPEGPHRLDRWRRAACSVLEGVVRVALARELGIAVHDWRAVGLSIFLAADALPDLKLALPDLVGAAGRASPGSSPRDGVAVYEAIAAQDHDAWATGLSWLRGDGPDAERWLAIGRWVLGAGLAARVGVRVEPVPEVDIPTAVPAWTWLRLHVPAHGRGGQIGVRGGAVVAQAWAVAGEPLRTLAGALGSAGELTAELGGPVGTWDCVSARGFGQTFGVRGMTWTFRPDGRLELLLADAFAGALDARELGDDVGTSGLVPGRWRVAGERAVRMSDLKTGAISMHGRGDNRYAVPASQLGMGQILQAMQASAWRWAVRDGELYLRGPLLGGTVELRLRPG